MGRCRLCRGVDYLCSSHLMPAALFRLLRSRTVTPRDPLVISARSTFQTSRQVSEHLLCVDCEDRLRRGGENWVLRHCYRGGGRFLLREQVVRSRLLDDGPVGRIYSSKSNPNIDSGALTFFAASIFWRAAAHAWQIPGRMRGSLIDLGPYQESLGKYLLGQEPFPGSAAMWVWISLYDKPSRAVTTPDSSRICNCHAHTFDIPGIRFSLFVGRTLPQFVRLMCVAGGPDGPIVASYAPDDILATQVSQISQTTRLSKALQRKGKWSWSP